MEDIYVLNKNLETIFVVDTYQSLIWTDKFNDSGDFELVLTPRKNSFSVLSVGKYLKIPSSDTHMIIEKISLNTDDDDGATFTISGRGVISILDRRVIKTQTSLKTKLIDGLSRLLDENAISPEDTKRTLPFLFIKPKDDIINEMRIETQFTGDNLWDVFSNTCYYHDVGIKTSLNNDKFSIELYKGIDRTSVSSISPYVVRFSPDYENLNNAMFSYSEVKRKTFAYVAGEGEGQNRTVVSVDIDQKTGLERKEAYVDARDLTSNPSSGNLTPSQYAEVLRSRGISKLNEEHKAENHLDGKINDFGIFKFGRDFFLGDIVLIDNGYGIEFKTQVIGYTRSVSENGEEHYPIFKTIQ